jgi:hypothetical protein
MLRDTTRHLLSGLRRLNRRWIDRLDPDWPPKAQAPLPAESPAPVAPASVTSRPSGPIDIAAITTPNPDALKFVCSIQLVDGPTTWVSGQQTSDPLGQALLQVADVRSAFAVGDFVTVTRQSGADWNAIEPQVRAAIRLAFSP